MNAPPPALPDSRLRRALASVLGWFDGAAVDTSEAGDDDGIDWLRVLPFLGMHLACLGVLWVGVSAVALWTALALYALRMFAITGFYHRYFSHKAFRTSRTVQFLFGVLGAASVQRGPLWWAAHHRHHHRHSDEEDDVHSPRQHGFWWAHVGWITSRQTFPTNYKAVPDLVKFPELIWLNRFDLVIPISLGVGMFLLGKVLERFAPQLGTNGPQMLIWGFFVSTVFLFHATCTINSLSHLFGRKRYATKDDSRNNFLLALLTLGEGWHNNHHRYPASTRQGFYWWEIDITYYALRLLSLTGLIWDLRPVPEGIRNSMLVRT